jgi:ABC-type thiamine transport system ATPase subunit
MNSPPITPLKPSLDCLVSTTSSAGISSELSLGRRERITGAYICLAQSPVVILTPPFSTLFDHSCTLSTISPFQVVMERHLLLVMTWSFSVSEEMQREWLIRFLLFPSEPVRYQDTLASARSTRTSSALK